MARLRRGGRTGRARHCLVMASCALGLARGATAMELRASPDVAVDLAGQLLAPGGIAVDLADPSMGVVDLGPLPAGTQIRSYAVLPGPVHFFTLGHTVELPGGITARPRDIVAWGGSSYNIALDGGSLGIPDGATIDALFLPPVSGLWLSFDTTISIGGTVVRDADVVDISLTPVFDSTAAGLPPGIDVDAASGIPGSPSILLSFDVGGEVGGVSFSDEDVLEYDPVAKLWSLRLDASAVSTAWEAGDVDAVHLVPEPGVLVGLVFGAGVLLLIGRSPPGAQCRKSAARPATSRARSPVPNGSAWAKKAK